MNNGSHCKLFVIGGGGGGGTEQPPNNRGVCLKSQDNKEIV